MPISSRRVSTGDFTYGNPWVGPVDHPMPIRTSATLVGAANLDEKGYLPPGFPLAADGTPVGADESVRGCTIEAVRLAESNSAGDVAAGQPLNITVGTIGQINRGALESNLGRALTADEVAGFGLAGSHIVLIA